MCIGRRHNPRCGGAHRDGVVASRVQARRRRYENDLLFVILCIPRASRATRTLYHWLGVSLYRNISWLGGIIFDVSGRSYKRKLYFIIFVIVGIIGGCLGSFLHFIYIVRSWWRLCRRGINNGEWWLRLLFRRVRGRGGCRISLGRLRPSSKDTPLSGCARLWLFLVQALRECFQGRVDRKTAVTR